MHKVITIDLNGRVYQLDERGYDALRVYVEHAESALGTNPDKAEIVRDLEQSVGDKFSRNLGSGPRVIATAEVEQVLAEIGPVDGGTPREGENRGPAGPAGGAAPAPGRLYQIREGAMLSGVCNGIAAFLHVDPTIVRIAFVAAAGVEMAGFDRPPVLAAGLYVVLMFLMPSTKRSPGGGPGHQSFPERLHKAVERVKKRFGARATNPL